MSPIPRPDLSSRPLTISCEYFVKGTPDKVYAAWTSEFDSWFAQAGTLAMKAELGRPFFFYTPDNWGRHPHYGRFLSLVKNELVEMTWMTGNGTPEGTAGAETLLRVELREQGEGTLLHLTHSGFINEKSLEGHRENWPLALQGLSESLSRESG